jgi:hypothetical protein
MKLPRTSIAGMMAAVAVVALDCFVLVMTDGGGVLLVGLILTVGFVCWWRGRGKGRRFWFGFEVAGLAAVLAYIGFVQTSNELILQWPTYLLNHAPYANYLWTFLVASKSQITGLVLFEVSYGLPMLLIASLGGLLAILVRPLEKVEHPSKRLGETLVTNTTSR